MNPNLIFWITSLLLSFSFAFAFFRSQRIYSWWVGGTGSSQVAAIFTWGWAGGMIIIVIPLVLWTGVYLTGVAEKYGINFLFDLITLT